jgi:hypothetical protein
VAVLAGQARTTIIPPKRHSARKRAASLSLPIWLWELGSAGTFSSSVLMLGLGAHAPVIVVCRGCRVESRRGRTAYAHLGRNSSGYQPERSRSAFSRCAQTAGRADTPRLRRSRGGWRCAATETGDVVAPEASAALVEAKRTLFRVLASLDRGTAASETDVSVPQPRLRPTRQPLSRAT